MSGYSLKQQIQSAANGDKSEGELRMTTYTQENRPFTRLHPNKLNQENESPQILKIPPSPNKSTSRYGQKTTPPKGVLDKMDVNKSKIPDHKNGKQRNFLNYRNPAGPVEPTWNSSMSHVRTMVHDSPLFARRPNAAQKIRGFFAENDTLPLEKSSAITPPKGPSPSRIPKRSPTQSAKSITSLDSSSSTAPNSQSSTTSSARLAVSTSEANALSIRQSSITIDSTANLNEVPTTNTSSAPNLNLPSIDDNPQTPTSKRKSKVDPPKTPNHINPDEGLSARQKVRVGLSGFLLSSESFRNSTGINSSGRTKRDPNPGDTRAYNLSQSPLSPTNSRTSSQGSLKIRTEALVTKLIPTKNSVHSLIGYIKELQSSEASLRTHVESIKAKAQEDLARSYGAVNKLQSSVRQIEEERDQKAQELAQKSHEIDTLQAKIEALRMTLEKSAQNGSSNHRQQLHAPSERISTINEEHEGHETREKSTALPPRSHQTRDLRSNLHAFFNKYDASRLIDVDTLIHQYHGQETQLLLDLERQYGSASVSSIMDMVSTTKTSLGPFVQSTNPRKLPTPFVMAPEVFQEPNLPTPLIAVLPPQPAQQEVKVLTSCIARHRSNRDESVGPPAVSPSSTELSPNGRSLPPLPVAEPTVNIYQKPRSPRHHPTNRAQSAIHNPFELSSKQPVPPPTKQMTVETIPNTSMLPTPPSKLQPVSPTMSPTNISLLSLVTDFYKTHQPDKLKDAKRVASAFLGNERELITQLKLKYGALSVKKIEKHLPMLEATGQKARKSGSSTLGLLIRFILRVTLLAVLLVAFGISYCAVSTHVACRSPTTMDKGYCDAWQHASTQVMRNPNAETVHLFVDLIPQAQSVMMSVGETIALDSIDQTARFLKRTIRLVRRMKPMAVPDFHGLELLDKCAQALDLLMHPDRKFSSITPRSEVLDTSMMWNILDLADEEAAKQMHWIES